jgi:hypothetical protein
MMLGDFVSIHSALSVQTIGTLYSQENAASYFVCKIRKCCVWCNKIVFNCNRTVLHEI